MFLSTPRRAWNINTCQSARLHIYSASKSAKPRISSDVSSNANVSFPDRAAVEPVRITLAGSAQGISRPKKLFTKHTWPAKGRHVPPGQDEDWLDRSLTHSICKFHRPNPGKIDGNLLFAIKSAAIGQTCNAKPTRPFCTKDTFHCRDQPGEHFVGESSFQDASGWPRTQRCRRELPTTYSSAWQALLDLAIAQHISSGF